MSTTLADLVAMLPLPTLPPDVPADFFAALAPRIVHQRVPRAGPRDGGGRARNRYGLSGPGESVADSRGPNLASYSFSSGVRMRLACSAGRDETSSCIQARTC